MSPVYYESHKAVRPIIMVRDTTLFPGQVAHFDVEMDNGEAVVEAALREKQDILLLTLKDPAIENPTLDDFNPFGCVIAIRQSVRMPNGQFKLFAEGVKRSCLTRVIRTSPYIEGEVVDYDYHSEAVMLDERMEMLMRLTASSAVTFLKQNPQIPEVFLYPLLDLRDPSKLADEIASNLDLRLDESNEILSELDLQKRLELVQQRVNYLSGLQKLDQEISERAMSNMNQSQKEYMLREQMNIIREELGEDYQDPSGLEESYRRRIQSLDMPEASKEFILKEVERIGYMPPMSPEMNVARTYLDTVLGLPWGVTTEDNLDLVHSREVLEKRHYGMKEVKERVLEFLAVRKLRSDAKGSILCLVGPPGVGKTSIVRSIAEAVNREFTSMRLGGMTDESEIRGHRKTYIGAMPGRIMTQIAKAKTMNPVFLLDEIDKVGSDFRGDPASALLEVLDPEQNGSFIDRYIEVGFDLSRVMFITTANTMDTIPRPLLDRMEVIQVSGYTEDEKFKIAKQHLLPKQREEAGLKATQLNLSDGALRLLISAYTRESGVRELERQIGKVCRRAAKRVVEGAEIVRVKKTNLSDFLGDERFHEDELVRCPQIGVVNGLAWTEVGGEILTIEANIMEGHGGIQLTGSLGEVMKESAQTAVSYIRSNAARYGISDRFHAVNDIHIHLPEGAVPKDGPSAGVAMFTALVSALTKRPVRHDISMTGEITLTGRVLPIGGVKEKVLASKRYNIKTVILPKANMKDLKQLDAQSVADMTFIPVERVDEVARRLLLDPVEVKQQIIFEREASREQIGFIRRTDEPMGKRKGLR